LVAKILPHQYYELKDGQLYCNVPITDTEAALGAEIEVPTLRGKISMKIPAGTQSGRVFRVKEQGFPSLDNKEGRGDFFVRTSIVIPRSISDEEKKLYQQLQELHKENPRAHLIK
jgi:DnaJ-class molecular chaperone